jgi:hypothetical protein
MASSARYAAVASVLMPSSTDRSTVACSTQSTQALLHRFLLGVVDDDDDRRARVLAG